MRLLTGLFIVLILAAPQSFAQDRVTPNAPELNPADFAMIRDRGTLFIGVKADYPPYASQTASGEFEGLEIDLARDLAERLELRPEWVAVQASNRLEKLEQGAIDVIIATMTDRPDRRARVRFVEPSYYASGINLLAPESADLADWQDLADRKLCAIEGAFYNQMIVETYGAEILPFAGTSDAYDALRKGECFALLYDDSAIKGQLSLGSWEGFTMPLTTIVEAPWGLAVRHGDGALAERLSAVVADWHREGLIVDLEAKWGLKPTPFALRMHERYLFR